MSEHVKGKTFGERVKTARKQVKLTQGEFAKLLGISIDYLGMIERGIRKPSEQLLQSVADATGTSRFWLETGTEPSEELALPDDEVFDVDNIEMTTISIPRKGKDIRNIGVNLRVLLVLSLMYTRNTKQTIADRLGIPILRLEQILQVRQPVAEEAWLPALHEIAAELDPDILMCEFNRTQRFIYDANSTKKIQVIKEILGDYYYSKGVELKFEETSDKSIQRVENRKTGERIRFVFIDFVGDIQRYRGWSSQLDYTKVESAVVQLAKEHKTEQEIDDLLIFVTTNFAAYRKIEELAKTKYAMKDNECIAVSIQQERVIEHTKFGLEA